MHQIEPYFNWRHLYTAEEDENSPFFNKEYSEFEFSNTVYNYYIHPQWDDFGSRTLYLKSLYNDYESGYAILEFFGEWNDVVENDIMQLKREVLDVFLEKGISKFILIMDNVLNAHLDNEDYYEEWYEDLKDSHGWITLLNTSQVVLQEMNQTKIGRYFHFMQIAEWRTHQPTDIFQLIDNRIFLLEN